MNFFLVNFWLFSHKCMTLSYRSYILHPIYIISYIQYVFHFGFYNKINFQHMQPKPSPDSFLFYHVYALDKTQHVAGERFGSELCFSVNNNMKSDINCASPGLLCLQISNPSDLLKWENPGWDSFISSWFSRRLEHADHHLSHMFTNSPD